MTAATIAIGFKWLIFVAMAVIAIGSSLMMVTRKNPIHSALWLIVTFCSVAGLYVLLNATFIAIAQVMVYAGAIMMLVIFVIMLIHLESGVESRVKRSFAKLIGAVITILLFLQVLGGFMVYGNVGKKGIYTSQALAEVGNAQAVGTVLYGKYVFAFEIASILLLVGIIGAVVLAKKTKD
jgi:NADH-quinone oxidoreductase subunit J